MCCVLLCFVFLSPMVKVLAAKRVTLKKMELRLKIINVVKGKYHGSDLEP